MTGWVSWSFELSEFGDGPQVLGMAEPSFVGRQRFTGRARGNVTSTSRNHDRRFQSPGVAAVKRSNDQNGADPELAKTTHSSPSCRHTCYSLPARHAEALKRPTKNRLIIAFSVDYSASPGSMTAFRIDPKGDAGYILVSHTHTKGIVHAKDAHQARQQSGTGH